MKLLCYSHGRSITELQISTFTGSFSGCLPFNISMSKIYVNMNTIRVLLLLSTLCQSDLSTESRRSK